MRSIYENEFTDSNFFPFTIEGSLLLTNENEMKIRYTKKVTDPTKFDELFIEVLILKLALKLVSLAGASPKMTEILGRELGPVLSQARAVAGQEAETGGRAIEVTWNDARFGGRSNDPSRH